MKCELFNGVTYYTDNDVCTDIDVTPDIKSVTLMHQIVSINRNTCKKEYPNVEELIIRDNVTSILIPNKMFPNIKKVSSKSKYFSSGKYLVKKFRGDNLLNAFGQSESEYINFGLFEGVTNYAFDGCKAKEICNYDDSKYMSFDIHAGKGETVYFKDKAGKVHEIESAILRRCVKASKYEGKTDNTYIIFPYAEAPISEDRLKKEFPKTYAYLDSYRDELAKRDMDKNVNWFLFGRSQGIQNSGLKKVVFKHIIDKNKPKIEPFILDDDVVVYSGRYVTAGTEEDLQKAYNIFKSEEFARYCALVGKNKAGGYVDVSTKAVKEFGVQEEQTEGEV